MIFFQLVLSVNTQKMATISRFSSSVWPNAHVNLEDGYPCVLRR